MIARFALRCLLLIASPCIAATSVMTVMDPCELLRTDISLAERTLFSVSLGGNPIVVDCPISMTLGDGTVLGENPRL